MYFADDAIIVTNPELSSCRDADKMVGFVSSRSRRAEIGDDVDPVSQTLLITRYDAQRVSQVFILRVFYFYLSHDNSNTFFSQSKSPL